MLCTNAENPRLPLKAYRPGRRDLGARALDGWTSVGLQAWSPAYILVTEHRILALQRGNRNPPPHLPPGCPESWVWVQILRQIDAQFLPDRLQLLQILIVLALVLDFDFDA